MRGTTTTMLLASFVALAFCSEPVHAQATRTWVSGVGDDANPCSRTAPCKTFAGAISKTAAGGEISVLDPGGFGAVTITKSISIVATSSEGGVLASGVNGITINAASTDTVHLQGLIIEGAGTGINGIRVLSAGNVTIGNCVIRGFNASGNGNAVLIEPPVNGARVHIEGSLLTKNNNGLKVRSTGPGLIALLDRSHVVSNTGVGIQVEGGIAFARINNSTIAFNGTGLSVLNGGRIISFGNNAIVSNTTNGAPTQTSPLQ
jgi:hypothetical protein